MGRKKVYEIISEADNAKREACREYYKRNRKKLCEKRMRRYWAEKELTTK